MKRILLTAICIACISLTSRSQSLIWTTWQSYDTTNTPELIFHFTNDSVQFSLDLISWTTIGGYTYTPNTYAMIDDPVQGCSNVTDTGRYNSVFSGDTMWLIPISDPCTERYDYLAFHYYVRLNTSIAESNVHDFTVTPNPTTGLVAVNASSIPEKIVIADISGRIVRDEVPSANTTTIDLGFSPPGIYFVTVYYADGFSTQRIIRQ